MNTFRFRAECWTDARRAMEKLMAYRMGYFNITQPRQDKPDVEVEFSSAATLDENRVQIMSVIGRHVMAQTLALADEYTGERSESTMTDAIELQVVQYRIVEQGVSIRDSCFIDRRIQPNGESLWSISDSQSRGNVLNKSLEWEYESSPSNRDNDFYTRTRFSSPEDCLRIYREWKKLHDQQKTE